MKLFEIEAQISPVWSNPDLVDEDGTVAVFNEELTSLEGAPRYITGSFYCGSNPLKSLKGGPTHVESAYSCSQCQIESFDAGPVYVGGDFVCSMNPIKSLHNIHQVFGTIQGTFWFVALIGGVPKIPSNILGLCLIKGIQAIKSESNLVNELFLKNKHDINLFQDALIDAGFHEQAKL